MKHLLSEYADILRLRGFLTAQTDIPCDVTVEGLTFDSREAGAETLFVCKGAKFNEKYLTDAVLKGACAYVSETRYNEDIPALIVNDIRQAMPVLAELFFDNAPEKLVTVGLTGTKGKTTTAYFIKNVLETYFKKIPAFLSSVLTYDGIISEESHMTTPEAIEFYRHCSNALSCGITHLVSEVSSQALKYGRVDGVTFDIGVFHNFGNDHISPGEHLDIDDYFSSKLKIFNHCKTALVNTDSDKFEEIIRSARENCHRVLTYGSDIKADYSMSGFEILPDRNGGCFTVTEPDGNIIKTVYHIPGIFNASNALCAVAVSRELGIPVDAIVDGIASAHTPGRMETYDSIDGKIRVFVDYAHNEMSFRSLYNSIESEFPGSPIISVFGCPGDKAFQRRPDLGRCSGKHSSLTVITEEDPQNEPVEKICREIASFVEESGGRYLIIPDRFEAISTAVREAYEMPGKVIIAVTGKGDEEFMKRGIGTVKIESDVSIVKRILGIK